MNKPWKSVYGDSASWKDVFGIDGSADLTLFALRPGISMPPIWYISHIGADSVPPISVGLGFVEGGTFQGKELDALSGVPKEPDLGDGRRPRFMFGDVNCFR